MYISDAVLRKDSIPYLKKKKNISILFVVLFALSSLLSIGTLVFLIVEKLGKFESYLFVSVCLATSLAFLYFTIRELSYLDAVMFSIEDTGSFVSDKICNVNVDKKISVSSIIYIIASVFVVFCDIFLIVSQAIKYNAETIYTISVCVALSIVILYQTFTNLVEEQLYKSVVNRK